MNFNAAKSLLALGLKAPKRGKCTTWWCSLKKLASWGLKMQALTRSVAKDFRAIEWSPRHLVLAMIVLAVLAAMGAQVGEAAFGAPLALASGLPFLVLLTAGITCGLVGFSMEQRPHWDSLYWYVLGAGGILAALLVGGLGLGLSWLSGRV